MLLVEDIDASWLAVRTAQIIYVSLLSSGSPRRADMWLTHLLSRSVLAVIYDRNAGGKKIGSHLPSYLVG